MPVLPNNLAAEYMAATKAVTPGTVKGAIGLAKSVTGSVAKATAQVIAPLGGGLGLINPPVLLVTGAILGLSEGVFTRSTAKTSLGDIEPSLLNKADRQRYYPGYAETIEATPKPHFYGGQGEGVQYGYRYQRYERVDPDDYYNRELRLNPTVRQSYTTFRGKIIDIYAVLDNQRQAEIANPDPTRGYSPGKGIYFVHRSGDVTARYHQGYDYGIKFVELFRLDGQPDVDGNISTSGGITSEVGNNPSPQTFSPELVSLANFFIGEINALRDDANFYNASLAKALNRINQNILAAIPSTPPQSAIVDSPDRSGYSSVYSDGYADGLTALLEARRIEAQNNKHGLDNSTAKPVAVPTINNPAQEKLQEKQVVEPTTKTTYETIGNSVTGTKVLKTVETTDSNGVTTVTKSIGDKTISIKREVPSGVKTTDLTVEASPLDNSAARQKYGVPTTTTSSTVNPVIATPSVTGIGATAIPQVPTVEQTPAFPEIAGLGLTAAAVGALIYSEQGMENLTSAAAAGTCRTTQPGGCMQNNVVNPLRQGQASLGELFNNIANTGIAAQNAAIQAIVTNTNQAVRHATYGLEAAHNFATGAWDTLKVDKMLTVMNTALLIHNATMLSNNIFATVGEVVDNTLATIGLNIKDANGNEIGFTQAVGKTATNLIKSVIGAENYDQLTQTWTRANRIYQSSMNVLSNVRLIIDSAQDIAEETGENVAFIGNALRRSGVVRENSYGWMSENLQTESRWLRRLDKINDTVDIFEDVTDSTRDISEELKELKENSENFKKEIEEYKKEKEEKEIKDKQDSQKTPDITEKDNQPSN